MKTSLNHTYRLVWSDALQTFLPVAECARGRGKGGKKSARARSLLLGIALLSGSAVHAQLPTGGQVVAGSASMATQGKTLTITQTSERMAADWQSFSIGQGHTVNFVQPGSHAVALNRVLGSDVSVIQGALNANGQVFLVNPNGVLFTNDAQVNVGGMVASTLNISTQDFMAGHYKFEGASSNAIVNQGRITAYGNGQGGGTVALIAAKISNEGTLTAEKGNVLMGAGRRVTLDLGGPVKIQVEEGALDALIEQGGAIKADGGLVYLTAKSAGDLVSTVINHTGITEAQTLASGEKGEIYLMGDMAKGRINVGGTLDASTLNDGKGGFIETSAAQVQVQAGTRVRAGHWLIDPTDITVDVNMATTLEGQLGSGDASVTTASGGGDEGDIFVNTGITWSSGNTLTLRADRNIEINAPLNAGGGSGGKIALEYGAGALAAGNTASYTIRAPISLQSGDNFSTKLGSDGTAINYTVVNSQSALQAMSLTGNTALGANLTFSGSNNWTPVGNNANRFTGNFNGLGNTITGLDVYHSSNQNLGLFGYVGSGGTVRNIGLVNANVTGVDGWYVGALVGSNLGTITQSYATGSVSTGSWYAGGLVGDNGGTIAQSYATSSVISTASSTNGRYVGGLAGRNNTLGTIKQSYATGSATGTNYVGGLVGYNAGSIIQSYATGNVLGSISYVGGLVGTSVNSGAITQSYALGSVMGTDYVGGLAGSSGSSGVITQSYATGFVTGSAKVGGLVGENQNTGGGITDSFWDADSTVQASAIGLGSGTVGELRSTTGTINAYIDRTYTGFDFNNTWWMADGATRPFLRSEWRPVITNAHELQLVASKPTLSYTLANNLDLAPSLAKQSEMWRDLTASGSFVKGSFAPVGYQVDDNTGAPAFTGSFNGSNLTISNLYISRPDTVGLPYANQIGLFGELQNAAVKDLNLTGDVTGYGEVGALAGSALGTTSISGITSSVVVRGNADVGGLVGRLQGSADNNRASISSSTSSGNVTANNASAGGLVGSAQYFTINNSNASGDIQASYYVGGLVARASNGTITGSHASGMVTGTDDDEIGGLAGGARNVVIENSYATGDVLGQYLTGGLVGVAAGGTTITNSYATGLISGVEKVGGLVGLVDGANIDATTTISDSYATGSVGTEGVPIAGKYVGGLVGRMLGFSSVARSYATSSVYATGSYIGGLIGAIEDSGAETRVTVSQSYATGAVSGDESIGGLIGAVYFEDERSAATITNTYASSTVRGVSGGGLVGYLSAAATVDKSYSVGSVGAGFGGLIGTNPAEGQSNVTSSYWDKETAGTVISAGGTSKTTLQMKSSGTYLGWDTSVWGIFGRGAAVAGYEEGEGLPFLTDVTRDEDKVGSVRILFDGGWGGQTASQQAGADGTAYGVSNWDQLQNINLVLGGGYSFELKNNLDTNSTGYAEQVKNAATLANGGLGWNPIGSLRPLVYNAVDSKWVSTGPDRPFVGVFDGKNNSITGLTIQRPTELPGSPAANEALDSSGVGLFGYVSGSSSEIRDLKLIDSVVKGYQNVGAVVGFMEEGNLRRLTVENIAVQGGGYYVGGIVGSLGGNATALLASGGQVTGAASGMGGVIGYNEGSVTQSSADVNVTSQRDEAGGLVGNNSGTITASSASGAVSGKGQVGGLVGYSDGSIASSHALGNVTNTGTSDGAGGLVGTSEGSITDSYASGNVTSPSASYAGGLVGYSDGNISLSYASGEVRGEYGVGGLVGWANSWSGALNTIEKSHASGLVIATDENSGGLVGIAEGTKIENSYASGSVTGTRTVGGLVGSFGGESRVGGPQIINSYAIGPVTGTSNVGGLVGYDSSLRTNNYNSVVSSFWDKQNTGQTTSAGGVGKTTAEMQDIALYSGWSIEDDTSLTDSYARLTMTATGTVWKIKSVANTSRNGGNTDSGGTDNNGGSGSGTGSSDQGTGSSGSGSSGSGSSASGGTGGATDTATGSNGGTSDPNTGDSSENADSATQSPQLTAAIQSAQQAAQQAARQTAGPSNPISTGPGRSSVPTSALTGFNPGLALGTASATGAAAGGSPAVLSLSGGLAFVNVNASPAESTGSGGQATGNAVAAMPEGAGRDPAGFMRVFVVNGGINLPTQASDAAVPGQGVN